MRRLVLIEEKRITINATIATMEEKQKRQYLAREAICLGYGGIAALSAITGVDRKTITKGKKEIENGDLYVTGGRNRTSGGGRKKTSYIFEKQIENENDNTQKCTDLKEVINDYLTDKSCGKPTETRIYTNTKVEDIVNHIDRTFEFKLSKTTCRSIT